MCRPADRLRAFAIGLATLAAPALAGQPTSLDQARAKLDAAEQDRAAALSEQQTDSERAAAAAAEAARLAAQRVAAESRLRDAQHATETAGARIQELQQARQDAAERVAHQAEQLQPLLPILERLSRFPAETVLAVELPPADAIRGVTVIRLIASEIATQAAELRKQQASLRAATDALAAAAPALSAAETAQAQAAADLARQVALAEAAQHEADVQAAAAGRRASRLEAEAASLRALLTHLQAEEDRRQRQALRQKAALAVPLHAPTRLLTPVSGSIIRNFGAPTDAGPASGVSYRAAPGASVVAPCAGRVLFASPFRSYGNLLILDCGGNIDVVLSGLQRFDLRSGNSVSQGERVGEMPTSNPVLYFELRRGDAPADPSGWLKSIS